MKLKIIVLLLAVLAIAESRRRRKRTHRREEEEVEEKTVLPLEEAMKMTPCNTENDENTCCPEGENCDLKCATVTNIEILADS